MSVRVRGKSTTSTAMCAMEVGRLMGSATNALAEAQSCARHAMEPEPFQISKVNKPFPEIQKTSQSLNLHRTDLKPTALALRYAYGYESRHFCRYA
jgi:hypothetical protein